MQGIDLFEAEYLVVCSELGSWQAGQLRKVLGKGNKPIQKVEVMPLFDYREFDSRGALNG